MKVKNSTRNIFFLTLALAVSFFVANRDLSIGSDSYNYARVFDGYVRGYLELSFGYMFLMAMMVVGVFSENYKVFFFFASFIVITGTQVSLMNLFFKNKARPDYNNNILFFFLFSLILLSPFFFAMQVNILRHGLAAPFLMLCYQNFIDRKYRAFLVFGFISIGFHWSAIYYVALTPLLLFRLRTIFFIVVLMSFLYLSGVTQLLFSMTSSISSLKDFHQFASEYGTSSEYRTGIRYDFWLFTSGFIILTALLEKNLKVGYNVTKIALITFLPFLMIGYLPYSDRLLAFSWFLIPLSGLYGFLFVARSIGKNVSFVFCFYLLLVSVFYSIYRVV